MYLYTIVLWGIVITLYGVMDVFSKMEALKINPSSDLYANEYAFQIVAFIFTKGVYAFIVLLLVLYVESKIFK